MGGLSRRRLQPRIVKKHKLKSVRRINPMQLPENIKKFWKQDKTLKENFESIGLTLKQNPNMKHTPEGKIVRKVALKKIQLKAEIKQNSQKEPVQWINKGELEGLRKQQLKQAEAGKSADSDDEEDDDEMDDEQQHKMLEELQDEEGEVEVMEEAISLSENGSQQEGEAAEDKQKAKDQKLRGKIANIDSEIQQEWKEIAKKKSKKQKHSLADVFAGMLPREEDIVLAIPQAKLRGDDVFIMERLIKKHSDDFDAMFRDIKLNYMQWSRGQLKTKSKSYFAYGMDKRTAQ